MISWKKSSRKIDWKEIARDLRADRVPMQYRNIKWYYR